MVKIWSFEIDTLNLTESRQDESMQARQSSAAELSTEVGIIPGERYQSHQRSTIRRQLCDQMRCIRTVDTTRQYSILYQQLSISVFSRGPPPGPQGLGAGAPKKRPGTCIAGL